MSRKKVNLLNMMKGKKFSTEPIVARVNGKLVDLSNTVDSGSKVEFLGFESEEGRKVYWHSTAHIMAHAVGELFLGVKFGIGPSIEDGFYYDFDIEHKFSPEDLEKIESKMKEIIERDTPFIREELSKEEAIKFFKNKGEKYKVELLEEMEESKVSIYEEGEFVDLCRGPHVPSTGRIRYFKLTSIAGAYWRGDERNPMLPRIYGTSYEKKEDLDAHLIRIEEAKKRDHRKLGPELDLFNIYEEAGPGLVIWHPKGAIVRKIIEDFWVKEHRKRGYELLYTPHIARGKLWQTSGHYDFYKERMYLLKSGDEEYVLKPMNCPYHILVYKSKVRSYKELPIRYAELGTVYRYERSGTLHGAMRVRGFTQDDAHIFCSPEQIKDELVDTIDLALHILNTFGFKKFKIDLSVRDPNHLDKYMGKDDDWKLAEESLEEALQKKGLPFRRIEGEAVFYGPKIDMQLVDALGRKWQATTIQFDFNIPKKFDVEYVAKDGKRHQIIMVHRAILGSLERFFGVLIEHYGGSFPLWLAPVQTIVMTVTDEYKEYASSVYNRLVADNFRVELDVRNEKIGFKIREAELKKIPYMLIIGKKELENKTVSLRKRKEGDLGGFSLEDVLKKMREDR